MADFLAGECYRLGLVRRGDDYERDAWTGLAVVLEERTGEGLWRCRWGSGESLVLSEERLRGSALLAGFS